MLAKRVIPCLDVHDGQVTRGVQFGVAEKGGLRNVGDPVELALRYNEQGADEMVFFDITATAHGRGTMVDVIERAAAEGVRLIVSVDTADEPRVPVEKRARRVERVAPGVYEIQLEFGFMDDPDVPAALAAITVPGIAYDPDDVTYFIGHESIVAGKAPGMHPIAEHLFVLLNRGADSAARFFNLPTDRVFEVGSRVEI